ncbi:MAG: hypothetical protein FWH55_10325 [Oscillospiraceae bacterium]|nr:hypothetical protein [Oscillospiraceae bacterium]
MKKEKRLLGEIDSWLETALIDEDTVTALKGLYFQKKNVNYLLVLFSIIGALILAGLFALGALFAYLRKVEEKLAPKAEELVWRRDVERVAYVTVRAKNGELVVSGLYLDGVAIEDTLRNE